MTYPYPVRNRQNQSEVLVFEQTVDNTTAASGVKTYDISLPPGAYSIGACVSSSGASATATLNAYAYQANNQTSLAAALSGPLRMLPHSGTAAVTTGIVAPSSATYAGSSGQLYGGYIGSPETYVLPYGLRISVTCNTNSGQTTHRIIAQQRS